MVTAQGLIGKFREALDENWGYIWGKYGQTWTEADQRNTTDEKARQYGAQWIGHRVADCSGLGYWAFRELGGFIVHGSNTIWNEYVKDRCELKNGQRTDGKPMFPGDPVFLKKTENGKISRHHIGYYVGDDTVIEAKGTQWGVVTSKLTRWHETAHWNNVQYDNGAYYPKLLTLKRGMSCDAVEELQALLNAKYGYDLEIDGSFGKATEAAVKDFQAKHNLTVDKIVGRKTWAALGVTVQNRIPAVDNGNNSVGDLYWTPEEAETIPDQYMVQVPLEEWRTIKSAIAAAAYIIKKYE